MGEGRLRQPKQNLDELPVGRFTTRSQCNNRGHNLGWRVKDTRPYSETDLDFREVLAENGKISVMPPSRHRCDALSDFQLKKKGHIHDRQSELEESLDDGRRNVV